MAWEIAPSIRAIFTQANQQWPQRSRASDGTIGDPAHAARTSAHNPGARNLVHAGDLTNDPAHGCDCNTLVQQIVGRRDPRIRLIIWNRRIWRSYNRAKTSTRPFLPAWTPEPYTGTNPHDKHAHLEILETVEAENDTRPWFPAADRPFPQPAPASDLTVHSTRHTIEGAPVIRHVVPVQTDAAGSGETGPDEGLHVDINKVLSVSSHAPHSANYGDGKYLLAPAGYHEARGELVVEVIGGPPNTIVYPIVVEAD